MNRDERVLEIEKAVRAKARTTSTQAVNDAMAQLRALALESGDQMIAPGLNVREALDRIRDVLVQGRFQAEYEAEAAVVKKAYDEQSSKRES